MVLLLGVVTDYAVFFLHGMRERLDAGETRVDAAEAATARVPADRRHRRADRRRAERLRSWPGELAFFRDFGPGMALTVLVSLVVAITLVPALMAILGQRAVLAARRGAKSAPTTGRAASPTS